MLVRHACGPPRERDVPAHRRGADSDVCKIPPEEHAIARHRPPARVGSPCCGARAGLRSASPSARARASSRDADAALARVGVVAGAGSVTPPAQSVLARGGRRCLRHGARGGALPLFAQRDSPIPILAVTRGCIWSRAVGARPEQDAAAASAGRFPTPAPADIWVKRRSGCSPTLSEATRANGPMRATRPRRR